MRLRASGLLSITVLCLGMTGSGAVLAQGTWNFGQSGPGSCNPGGSPATAACTVGSVTAGISAWGSAGSGFVQGSLAEFDPNGFGAYTGSSETGTNAHHAFDNKTTACGSGATNTNCGGTIEAMLLNFGSTKVSLTQISIGFFSGDSDLSVYRWDGAASLGTGLTGASASVGTSTALTGWTLVGSGDIDSLGNTLNTGNAKYSSYFLITTYFGANAMASNGAALSAGGDAFKILTATANKCVGTLTGGNGGNGGNGSTCTPGNQTPEPGALALMAVALVGAGFARRSKRG